MQVGKVNGSADVVTAAHSVVPVETLLDLHAYDGESERPDKFEEKGYLLTYFHQIYIKISLTIILFTFYTFVGPIWTHPWGR